MFETDEQLSRLQALLDRSDSAAGSHLRGIITAERRLTAAELCRRLQGMRLLVVSTVTADGRPLAGPVDGYFVQGSWWFSSSPDSVRFRHLRDRPAISACHVPDEELAVTVHGTAELCDLHDAADGMVRQAMLDHYLPKQGPAFEEWLETAEVLCARIDAQKMFTFHLDSGD